MATILYFFPMNPERVKAGNELHARNILKYFRDRNHIVDLISSNDYWGGVVDPQDVQSLFRQGLIRNHYNLSKKPQISGFRDFIRYEIIRFIRKKLKFRKPSLSNFVTDYSKSQFTKILKAEQYDYIIVSYAFWAELIKNNRLTGAAKTIIDTHDFLTAQEYAQRKIRLGAAFSEEIQRLNLFDEIWTVSSDEHYLFSQFCQKPVRLVPICTDKKPSAPYPQPEFDLIFVGGDNPHNIKAMDWFFKQVYPLLPESIHMCLVGKITAAVSEYPNVTKIPYAENLDRYYQASRISICPLLSGTGTKVKVIEALSYGLPIVCSPRGTDGLVNKRENGCLIAEKPAEFAKAILRLLENNVFYTAIQKQAEHYHDTYHTLNNFYETLDGLIGGVGSRSSTIRLTTP